MFSLRIYRYSLGNLTIEILKVVEKCNSCYNKGYHGSWRPRHLTKNYPGGWDLTSFENLLGVAMGPRMVTLGIDWDMINSYIPSLQGT